MPDASRSWFVYMLRCRDGTLYTGATNDLERRLATHGRGKGAAYTRARLPVTLVWSEPVEDRSAALRREAALKRLPRGEKLRLIKPLRGRSAGRWMTRPGPSPGARGR